MKNKILNYFLGMELFRENRLAGRNATGKGGSADDRSPLEKMPIVGPLFDALNDRNGDAVAANAERLEELKKEIEAYRATVETSKAEAEKAKGELADLEREKARTKTSMTIEKLRLMADVWDAQAEKSEAAIEQKKLEVTVVDRGTTSDPLYVKLEGEFEGKIRGIDARVGELTGENTGLNGELGEKASTLENCLRDKKFEIKGDVDLRLQGGADAIAPEFKVITDDKVRETQDTLENKKIELAQLREEKEKEEEEKDKGGSVEFGFENKKEVQNPESRILLLQAEIALIEGDLLKTKIEKNLGEIKELEARKTSYLPGGANKTEYDSFNPAEKAKFVARVKEEIVKLERQAKKMRVGAKYFRQEADSIEKGLPAPMKPAEGKKTHEQLEDLKREVEDVRNAPRYAAVGAQMDDPEKAFRDKIRDLNQLDQFNARETLEFNAEELRFDNEDALMKTVDIYVKLGWPEEAVKWMANQLSYGFAADGIVAKSNVQPSEVRLYQSRNLTDAEVAKIHGENPNFANAYRFFDLVRDELVKQQKYANQMGQKNRESKEEPVTTFATDKGGQFISHISDAWKRGDWLVVALDGALAVGAVKFLKGLFGKGGGEHGHEGSSTDWGKWVLYGAAGYAGMCVFAPDKMKDLWGKGINADVAGTRVQDLMNWAKNDKDVYEHGLDAGTSMAISTAYVSDVYGALSNDPASAANGMIQLTNPGIRGCFRDSSIIDVGPVNLDSKPYEKLSGKEKLYVDACKKLYETTFTIREMYNRTIYERTHVSFEKAFLNSESATYRSDTTMTGLYYILGEYANQDRKGTLLDFRDFETAKKELGDEFVKNTNLLQLPRSKDHKGNTLATVFNFPVTMSSYMGGSDGAKKIYKFTVLGDELNPVEYEVGQDSTLKAGDLKKRVEERMKALVLGVSVDSGVDIKKAGESLQYNSTENKWTTKVGFEGYPGIGIPGGNLDMEFKPKEDGMVLEAKITGADSFVTLDSKQSLFKTAILVKALGDDDLKFFKFFQKDSGALDIEYDVKGGSNKFMLVVRSGGERFSIEVTYDGSGDYSVDPTALEDLIQSDGFINRYVETRLDSRDVSDTFLNFKVVISQLNEEYLTSIFQNIWSAFKGGPASGFADGSIRDKYLDVLVDSKKIMMAELLRRKLKGCKTPADVDRETSDVVTSVQSQMEIELAKIRPFIAKNQEIDKEDAKSLIEDPIMGAGIKSVAYKYAVERFMKNVVGQHLLSDVVPVDGKKTALQKLRAFYYYTAHLDGTDLDTQITLANRAASLDIIKKQLYFEYVEDQLRDDQEVKEYADWEQTVYLPKPIEKMAPLSAARIEKILKQECLKMISSEYDQDDQKIAKAVFATYNQLSNATPAKGFFPIVSNKIVKAGHQNRDAQMADMPGYVDEFRAKIDEKIRRKQELDLSNVPGVYGTVRRWIFQELNI